MYTAIHCVFTAMCKEPALASSWMGLLGMAQLMRHIRDFSGLRPEIMNDEIQPSEEREDEIALLEEREREIPRWVQIPIGLLLGLLTLSLGLASIIGLLFTRNEKAPILAIIVGIVLLLLGVWVMEKCFRLVTGRKNRGGLMSPTTLRVISVFFLIFPVVGLFTGYYRKMGSVAIFQAVMYFSAFAGLQSLARKREATAVEDLPHVTDNRASNGRNKY